MNLLLCLGYFVTGIARDAMGAVYYRAISRNRAFSASAWAGAITAFDLFILATLLVKWELWLALSYVLGTALGTFLVMTDRWKR